MPVVDPNNWVPQYDAREDQETITPITQPDGSVRYFQGNYDEVGEIDRVIIEDPGKYAAGVTPRVRLVDENGDEIAPNGAAFRLMMSSRGEILEVETGGRGAEGRDFTDDMDIEFVVENAADCLVPAKARAVIKRGQWMDHLSASDVDRINARARAYFEEDKRKTARMNENIRVGTTDFKGTTGDTIVSRDSIKGMPGM